MKPILATLAAAGLALSLSACNPQQEAAVRSVQDAAVAACGFLPAAKTILAIFNSNPAVATASVIADGICSVVTKKGAAEWKYNGIPIEGRFVK